MEETGAEGGRGKRVKGGGGWGGGSKYVVSAVSGRAAKHDSTKKPPNYVGLNEDRRIDVRRVLMCSGTAAACSCLHCVWVLLASNCQYT